MPEARRETVHRMTRRCDGWDYRQRAIYQVTLVQADRARPLLGRLVIDDPKAPPEAVTARVEPSELGAAILAHWKRLGDFTPEIKPLFCQLMPDHLHAILEVTRPRVKPLGNAIGGFKTGCEKIYRELALSAQNKALSAQNKALSERNKALSAQDKAPSERNRRACSVPEARASGTPRLWAAGFQDSILFRAGQLDAMFNYLRDNPRRLAVKWLFPDLFRAVAALRRPLPSLGVVGAFAAKAEALLARARQGAALLSPCVSEGEREIARRAFAEGQPLVVLRNKGFAPLEKPGGRHFDACAAGRLLMLAPATWPHVPGEKPMTRRDALALNRLAQALAEGGRGPGACAPGTEQGAPGTEQGAPDTEQGAAPIAYRGVTFAEVDDWARAAVNLAPRPRAYPVPEARARPVPEARAYPVPEARVCPVPEARASGNGRERRAERLCHG